MLLNTLLACVMLLLPSAVCAQNDFVQVEWNLHSTDSVLPLCTNSIPLGKDFSDIDYSVSVEYPVYASLTKDELRVARRFVSQLSSEPIVNTHIGVSRREGVLDAWFVPVVLRNGEFLKLTSFRWKVSAHPSANTRSLSRASSMINPIDLLYTRESVLSSGRWVKIRVSDRGVYKLTNSALRKMGFSNPAKVRLYGHGGNVMRETNIQNLPDDLTELPMHRVADGALFYAYGPVQWTYNSYKGLYEHKNNPYSSYSYYFLTEDDSVEPMTIAPDGGIITSQSIMVDVGADYSLYEKDVFCWLQTGSMLFDPYEYSGVAQVNYPFKINNVASQSANVTVSFSASASTNVSVGVDGKNIGSLYITSPESFSDASVAKASFSISSLADNPTLSLSTTKADAHSHLDYIELNYSRNLVMDGPQLLFRNPKKTGAVCFRVSGAFSPEIQVWRVSSPTLYSKLDYSWSNDWYCDIPTNNTSNDEYLVFDAKGSFPSPTVVGKVENQNLHSVEAADMVIIVPESGIFTSAAKRLAAIHENYDGMKVLVVRADQIYNEFSSGTPDATAYRRFMKMLYDRASNVADAPRYLLLLGDGSWDNRMLSAEMSGLSPSDFLLCYESENSVSETDSYVCEDYFGFLDNGEGGNNLYDKVDIGVGRIPVRTPAEADAVVAKIEAYYANNKVSSWKNTVLVVADDGNENDHMVSAERVASQTEKLYPGMRVERVYFDNYERVTTSVGDTYPMARARLSDILDAGALFVDYSGHGNPVQLSHEMVILHSDFEKSNNGRMPFWLTAACDVAPFDKQAGNIGETALLNPQGGAVGFIGTTRTVYSTQNEFFNVRYSKYVFAKGSDDRTNSVGDALRLTKNSLVTSGADLSCNKLHYVLLGDPAMPLLAPKNNILIDSIAGVSSAVAPTIKAGQLVRVAGHIETPSGDLINDFDGVVYSSVYDCIEHIVTRNNDKSADSPFSYDARTKKLYSGSDSVLNGRFSFQFPVPYDINYSDLSGLINTYACSADGRIEANGSFDGFTIGGAVSGSVADTIGPKIYAYLNYEEFPHGGTTGPTPYFVARLSDESGINVVGNSIGHDLELIIDNDALKTYNLNNYYESTIGSYTSGTVAYTLPALSDGEHTLFFRAWDIHNNSSSTQFKFRVSNSLPPSTFGVVARQLDGGPVEFVVSTDLGNQQATSVLELFDASGRKLYEYAAEGTCQSGIYTFTWDGKANSARVLPGVYLYTLTMKSSGGTSSSVSNKIVLSGQ